MKVIHLMAGGKAAGGIESLMVDYSKVSKNENTFVFAWGEGPSVKWIRNTASKVIVLNGKKTGNLIMVLSAIKRITAEKPDYIIVHHATPELRFIGILLAIKFPIYIYHHCFAEQEYDSRGLKKLITHCIYLTSVRIAKTNIAISQAVKKSVCDRFRVSKDQVKVIYNGVDISKFRPSQKKSGMLRIIYVGRLEKCKGVQNVLRTLSKSALPFKFSVVGEGNYADSLRQMTRDLGITDRVEFLGRREDIGELLSSSNVFIHLPDWEEGFGLSIVEAMASGLVCICGNRGAIPEIIDNGVDGYLVEQEKYDDSENLDRLLRVVYDPNNINELNRVTEAAIKKSKMFLISEYAKQIDLLAE